MIRKFVFLIAVASFALSCKKGEIKATSEIPNPTPVAVDKEAPAQTPNPPADGKYPVMTFAETEHDFGDIPQREKVTHEFEFKNTGEADLLITRASGSCGCTVPEYPKDPIKPGQTGTIKVVFSPGNRNGLQNKSVTIYTNTANGIEKLKIKASVRSGSGVAQLPNN